LNGESNISPEMALRLSITLGRSAESWLAMQDHYDLWHAKKTVDLKHVKKINLNAA
ncbi:MAG: HigA family addiction module antitoxin, partial [Gammaproteobacteria bacterium]|nr:HigA family addiction module antitoxin [Gammaproteobacteria bacterium]